MTEFNAHNYHDEEAIRLRKVAASVSVPEIRDRFLAQAEQHEKVADELRRLQYGITVRQL